MPGDTRNKRSKLQIKKDRARIAELYIQGWYQSQIAEKLGVTQQQISYDLKAIQREWVQNTTVNLDEHKAKEVAKIDHLERTYWQAWDRSLEKFNSKITKGKDLKPINNESTKKGSIEQTLKVEDRDGNPKFLEGIQWCIEQRCKIFGHYYDPKLKLPGEQGQSGFIAIPVMQLNEEEWQKQAQKTMMNNQYIENN